MPFSDNFLEQAFNGGPTPIIELLRVNVDGEIYYYANNTTDVISTVQGGPTLFKRGSFKLNLPEDKLEGSSTATLDFNAADIEVVEYLRNSSSRLVMDLWLVLADNPNVAEWGPVNFEIQKYNISGSQIRMDLTAEPDLEVTLPGKRYTPATFPKLWD